MFLYLCVCVVLGPEKHILSGSGRKEMSGFSLRILNLRCWVVLQKLLRLDDRKFMKAEVLVIQFVEGMCVINRIELFLSSSSLFMQYDDVLLWNRGRAHCEISREYLADVFQKLVRKCCRVIVSCGVGADPYVVYKVGSIIWHGIEYFSIFYVLFCVYVCCC
jgi:hypothetical protein